MKTQHVRPSEERARERRAERKAYLNRIRPKCPKCGGRCKSRTDPYPGNVCFWCAQEMYESGEITYAEFTAQA